MAMDWLTNMFRHIVVDTILDAEKEVSEPSIVITMLDDKNPLNLQQGSTRSPSDLMAWSEGIQSRADLYTATYAETFGKHGVEGFTSPERKKRIDDGLRLSLAQRAAFLRMVGSIRKLENIHTGRQYHIQVGNDVYSLTGAQMNAQLPLLREIEQGLEPADAVFDRLSAALTEIKKNSELLETQKQQMREAKERMKATEPKAPSLGARLAAIFKRKPSALEQAQQTSLHDAARDNLEKAEAAVAATEAAGKLIQAKINDVRFPQRHRASCD
jgi:hypothetical protein